MRKAIFAIMLVALVAAAAFGRLPDGGEHENISSATDVTGLDDFKKFYAVNVGAADVVVQFYYGSGLATEAFQLPAGGTFSDPSMSRAANGYRLTPDATTTVYTYYDR